MTRLALVLAICSVVSIARADVDEDTANRLYDEAQDDFAAGKFDLACPKLETSVRLRSAIKPLGLLAACYEQQGRLATAWRTFKDVRKRAEGAGDNDVAVAAAAHVARLEPKLARLTIQVPERIDGLVIKLAGTPLATADLDRPLEIDAGTYQLAATASNGQTWEKSLTIRDGDIERVDIPKLAPPSTAEVTRSPPPPLPAPAQRPSKRKLIGLGAIGGGAIVTVVGGVLGLSARSTWNDAKSAGCDDEGRCPTVDGVDLVGRANDKATLSTIAVGVGVVAVATGVVLYLTAPRRAERGVALTVSGRAIAVQGRF